MKAYEYDSHVPSNGFYNGINSMMTDCGVCKDGF